MTRLLAKYILPIIKGVVKISELEIIQVLAAEGLSDVEIEVG